MIRDCDFNFWDATTTNFGNVGVFGSGRNVVVLENTFNGNTSLAPATFAEVSTNTYYSAQISGVGLVWLQIGGNFLSPGTKSTITCLRESRLTRVPMPSLETFSPISTIILRPLLCALMAAIGRESPARPPIPQPALSEIQCTAAVAAKRLAPHAVASHPTRSLSRGTASIFTLHSKP